MSGNQPNPTTAVIIPTKDRPELLNEAIESVLRQTHPAVEIIVVDDASQIPVSEPELRSRFGNSLRVIRNEQSMGLAYSRNLGVEQSTSDFITHLDDDDMLAEDAIERCLKVFQDFPDIELLFYAAEGFGPSADHFNRVQPQGNKRVVELGLGQYAQPDIILFGQELFLALLRTVPIAFQRIMVSKEIWKEVSELRWRVYTLDTPVSDLEAAKRKITGPLRDSEWARYAALVCNRSAFLDRPLYIQRCAGQGYSSQPANRSVHLLQGLNMIEHMARATSKLPALANWKAEILNAHTDSHFHAAYESYEMGNKKQAWKFLLKDIAKRETIKRLKLALKILFIPSQNMK